MLGLAGAVVLVVAEFTPLAHLASSARGTTALPSLNTGSHNAYALIPLALLAGAFSLAARSGRARLAMLAVGILGLVALGIALIGDLPDAQATGLIRHPGTGYVSAAASPAAGFFLETLGGVLLLIAAAAGVLLLPGDDRIPGAGRRPTDPRPERSAS